MNANDPVFPTFDINGLKKDGLTKREYAAIKIMAGLAAFPDNSLDAESASLTSVIWADELFKELEKNYET
jgi:hypothetical protein